MLTVTSGGGNRNQDHVSLLVRFATILLPLLRYMAHDAALNKNLLKGKRKKKKATVPTSCATAIAPASPLGETLRQPRPWMSALTNHCAFSKLLIKWCDSSSLPVVVLFELQPLLHCPSHFPHTFHHSSLITHHYQSPLTNNTTRTGKPIELFWINNFVTPQELVRQTSTPLRNNRYF